MMATTNKYSLSLCSRGLIGTDFDVRFWLCCLNPWLVIVSDDVYLSVIKNASSFYSSHDLSWMLFIVICDSHANG